MWRGKVSGVNNIDYTFFKAMISIHKTKDLLKESEHLPKNTTKNNTHRQARKETDSIYNLVLAIEVNVSSEI